MTDCKYCGNEVDNLKTHVNQFHQAMEDYANEWDVSDEEKKKVLDDMFEQRRELKARRRKESTENTYYRGWDDSNIFDKLEKARKLGLPHDDRTLMTKLADLPQDFREKLGEVNMNTPEGRDVVNSINKHASQGGKWQKLREPWEMEREGDPSVGEADNFPQVKGQSEKEWKEDLQHLKNNISYKWDNESYNTRVESFESLGYTQGDALKLADLTWYDLSNEVQQALEESITSASDDDDGARTDLRNSSDNDEVDYNKIGESLTLRTKYECEQCYEGFKSNEALDTHYNDKHAISTERVIDGYEGQWKGGVDSDWLEDVHNKEIEKSGHPENWSIGQPRIKDLSKSEEKDPRQRDFMTLQGKNDWGMDATICMICDTKFNTYPEFWEHYQGHSKAETGEVKKKINEVNNPDLDLCTICHDGMKCDDLMGHAGKYWNTKDNWSTRGIDPEAGEANPNHANDGKFSSGSDITNYSDKHDVYFKGKDGKINKQNMSIRQYNKASKTHDGDSGWGVNARDLEREYNKQNEALANEVGWFECQGCNKIANTKEDADKHTEETGHEMASFGFSSVMPYSKTNPITTESWFDCDKRGLEHKWVDGQDGQGNPDIYCQTCGVIKTGESYDGIKIYSATESVDFKEDEHPRADDGKFTSGGSGSSGKHSDKSEKDLVKGIKAGSANWKDWYRNETNEELYQEIEKRNRAIPFPKRPEGVGATIFRDDPDAVSKMENKIKYLEDIQDYWKKIIKFPARDYHTKPHQLGDAKWYELTGASTNLRDARKKLEGIKMQQDRGTQLVRKATYPDGKKRFYYSEEPKTGEALEDKPCKNCGVSSDWNTIKQPNTGDCKYCGMKNAYEVEYVKPTTWHCEDCDTTLGDGRSAGKHQEETGHHNIAKKRVSESHEELECPECNSSKVHPNRQKGDDRFGQGDYACNNCGATFGSEAVNYLHTDDFEFPPTWDQDKIDYEAKMRLYDDLDMIQSKTLIDRRPLSWQKGYEAESDCMMGGNHEQMGGKFGDYQTCTKCGDYIKQVGDKWVSKEAKPKEENLSDIINKLNKKNAPVGGWTDDDKVGEKWTPKTKSEQLAYGLGICPFCKESFDNETSFDSHVSSMHSEASEAQTCKNGHFTFSQTKVKCPKCGEPFESNVTDGNGNLIPTDELHRIGESLANEDGGYANFGALPKEKSWSVMTVASDLYYFNSEQEAKDYVKNFPNGTYDIRPPRER